MLFYLFFFDISRHLTTYVKKLKDQHRQSASAATATQQTLRNAGVPDGVISSTIVSLQPHLDELQVSLLSLSPLPSPLDTSPLSPLPSTLSPPLSPRHLSTRFHSSIPLPSPQYLPSPLSPLPSPSPISLPSLSLSNATNRSESCDGRR